MSVILGDFRPSAAK